jgi:geranylgeranyl reductase family protein
MNAAQLPVLVAGAGPGGAAAALSLRRHGIPVVLFDRARFPRDKVCGDVVLPEAQQAIRTLGLPWQDLVARSYPCTGSRYVAADGAEVDGVFRDGQGRRVEWWIVKRLVLDNWLVEQAVAAGAVFRPGHEVQSVLKNAAGVAVGLRVRCDDGVVRDVRGSAVVGADGATSAVARSLDVFNQFPEHVCLAARAYVRGVSLPHPYLEIFTTPRTLPGCTWILPVGPDEVNVGVGIIKADADRLGVTPRQLFDEVMEQCPQMKQRLGGADIPKLKGWSLPGSSEERPLVGHGTLLVGDAGAMVDPFTGHGIHHALWAGIHAGDVLANALAKGDVTAPQLMAHEHRCRSTFLAEAQTGYRLQRVHASPALMSMATRLCAHHKGLHWAFLSLLGHATPRHDVLGPKGLWDALFTSGPTPQEARS